MTPPPSSHIAHYRVLSKLGAGGGGEVLRCFDERLGREVAVKVMPDAQLHNARAIARFRREARVGHDGNVGVAPREWTKDPLREALAEGPLRG